MGREAKSVKVSDASEDKHKKDLVACESEVILKVNGRDYIKVFCLPSLLKEFALGHMRSKGLDLSLVSDLKVEEINSEIYEINVVIKEETYRDPSKVTFERRIKKGEVINLARKLDEGRLYKETGGTHVAHVSNDDSITVEDVSRHCAIDKAIGVCAKKGLETSKSILATSCRQTHTTIMKAIMAKFPNVISLSAPTQMVINDSKKFGVTLIGFARKNRFNVYANEWRIS